VQHSFGTYGQAKTNAPAPSSQGVVANLRNMTVKQVAWSALMGMSAAWAADALMGAAVGEGYLSEDTPTQTLALGTGLGVGVYAGSLFGAGNP
jgi:hypothetical protein